MSAQQEESFDDVGAEEQDYQGTEEVNEGLDTFDNPSSPINQLEEKEDALEEKEVDEKPEEGKEDKPKDEKPDDGEKKEEVVKEPKIEGKSLKLFRDGQKYEVPEDATVKVKIDGRSEKVTIQELRDNYSGQKAWDKKFSDAGDKEKRVSEKEAELDRVQTTIKNRMGDVSESLKSALSEGGNPMDAVSKIVDMLGVDSYDFNRALMDSMTDELVTLDQMDEYELQAHWLQKRNDHLTQKHESFEENLRQTQAQEERFSRVDQMREAQGVSEDAFVSAHDMLSQGGRDVTPEQVIQYAANLPHVEAAEELLTPYEDQLSDDEFESTMAKIANTMKKDSSITREDMTTYLAEIFQVDSIIDQANNKAERLGAGERSETKQPYSRQDSSLESFDDFNY
jgi:hypothetical protein